MIPNEVLFTDAKGDYTLHDLIKAARTWTDDPTQQRLLVDRYMHGIIMRRNKLNTVLS